MKNTLKINPELSKMMEPLAIDHAWLKTGFPSKGVSTLYWPGNSTGLNPVKYLLAIVKNQKIHANNKTKPYFGHNQGLI